MPLLPCHFASGIAAVNSGLQWRRSSGGSPALVILLPVLRSSSNNNTHQRLRHVTARQTLASSRLPGRMRPPTLKVPQVQRLPRNSSRQAENTRWDNTLLDRGPISEQFYQRHASTILQPQFAGRQAWTGLVSLTTLNLLVLFLWNPDGFVEAEKQVATTTSTKSKEWENWMNQNFTTNIINTQQRPWTLATASISHKDSLHFFGNMFALWLFGFPTYRVIGTKAFCGLYLAGGLACSGTHVVHNWMQGRTGPPLTLEERRWLEQYKGHNSVEELPRRVQKRLATFDRPALGASGSVMALAAVAATLFPLDKVRPTLTYQGLAIPLPSAVLLFFLSDLSGITQGNSSVDHVGHLGGMVIGILYVTVAWYSKAGSFRILHSHPTGGQLPLLFRIRQWSQGNNPWQR